MDDIRRYKAALDSPTSGTVRCHSLSEFAEWYSNYGSSKAYDIVTTPSSSVAVTAMSILIVDCAIAKVDVIYEDDDILLTDHNTCTLDSSKYLELLRTSDVAICFDANHFWKLFSDYGDTRIYEVSRLSHKGIFQIILDGYKSNKFSDNFLMYK